MQLLIENWRKYSLLAEEQLIIEGRIDDVKAKYPEIAKKREELDGESALDAIINADPSGNQKYLMGAARMLQRAMNDAEETNGYKPFWGKLWPDDADDNLYSPWGVARNIADELSKYHNLMPFIRDQDHRLQDLNNIKTYSALQSVVNAAQAKKASRDRAKELKKREKTQAGEESTIVMDNDSYTMLRPTTAHASCYYGKGTKWCISATQSSNYFDEYTNDGKSFYFVFFANISNINPFKKIALVVGYDGTYEEAFNAEDDSLSHGEVVDAIIQNLLHEKEDAGALMAYRWYDNDRYADELTDKDKADYVKKVKELGIAWDDVLATSAHLFKEEAERANEAIRNTAELIFSGMKKEAETNHEEDSPGPTEEQYNEVLAKYEPGLNNISVSIQMPYDTGASTPYWDATMYIDIEAYVMDNKQRLKWKKSTEQIAEEEDELRQAVDLALNTVDIWPNNLEQEYKEPFRYYVTLDPGAGSPDEFESYMDNIQYIDETFTNGFAEALLEELAERELIGRDTREEEYWPDPEEKKKQIELPFEAGAKEEARHPKASAAGLRSFTENKIRIKIVKF